MAEITGVKGIVTIDEGALAWKDTINTSGTPNAIAHVTRWTLNIRRDILPRDTFDTTDNAKRKIGAMYDAAGMIEGFLDSSSILSLVNIKTEDYIPDVTATFQLKTRAGIGYVFAGIVSNLRFDVPKNGPAVFTADFESDGEVTEL